MSAPARKGRWADAALAALATFVASWPVTGLLATQPWVGPTLLLLAAVGVVGALVRARTRLPAWAVVTVQGAVAAVALTWLLAEGTHRYGLPTAETARTLHDLWLAGAETIRTETVPAPATDGLVLIVVAGLVAVGLAVDALAVTGRSPAAAGIPLLVVCTVTASNSGEALHPRYFLAAAGAWLLMLGRQGMGSLRRWPTAAPDGSALTGGARRYGSRARVLGVATALLAVVVPGFLPHLPPTTVLEGLGAGGEVTFTETLDLSADLSSRSNAPVLRYRTDETRPTPLKVAASTTYADGRWQPDGNDDATRGRGGIPAGTVAPGVDLRSWSLTVVESSLRPPQLAVPTPMLDLDVGELAWEVSPYTGTVTAAERPETYEASAYRTVGALPDEVGQGAGAALGDAAVLELDPASADRVLALTAEVTADATTQLQAARRIQDHLRSSPYVYSLTLADPVDGPDGRPLDPLSHFLETKQGYCTQFATAMVMMARAWGIPARIAVGFLPGDSDDDGTWTVVAADAHAWPELYVNGLGWTRFEPTPGTRAGLAPVYYTDADLTAGAEAPTTAPDPAPTRAPVDPVPRSGAAAGGDDGFDVGALLARVLPALGWLLAAAALAAVVPAAGWWRRSAALRAAATEDARIEGHWSAMGCALGDLGLPLPPAATPRQARAHLAATLPAPAVEALDRAAARVERARYAPGGAPEGGMAEDVAAVVAGARTTRTRRARLRALLLPRSGLVQLAVLGARAADLWRETTRRVRRLVPRSGT